MKLAEALQERADLNQRIEQLRARLNTNAVVQEGEQPAEDPKDLIKELNVCTDRLESLILQINVTNCHAQKDGATLTEMLAQKDCLKIKIQSYRELIDSASRLAQRATRTEIKIKSSVNVKELQKTADEMAKRLRELDNKIQELNWTTEI